MGEVRFGGRAREVVVGVVEELGVGAGEGGCGDGEEVQDCEEVGEFHFLGCWWRAGGGEMASWQWARNRVCGRWRVGVGSLSLFA